MNTKRIAYIVLAALAVLAAAVLFVTYGTVLPSAPLSPIQLNGPTLAASDGKMTVVVDSDSRRALIMNADGDLTGVVSCTTPDSPIDAITNVCVSKDFVYIAGVRFAPDSDIINLERVVAYDKGGNLQGLLAEEQNNGSVLPVIQSINPSANGIVIAHSGKLSELTSNDSNTGEEGSGDNDSDIYVVAFTLIDSQGMHLLDYLDPGALTPKDAAFSSGETNHYATLNVRGVLGGVSEYAKQIYSGHVFTAIALDNDGTLFACDDETDSLCAISPGSADVRTVIQGEEHHSVHVCNGLISLCDSNANKVTICDTQGNIQREFTEVIPSAGFSTRMLAVWASGIYLVVLILVLIIRKIRRQIKEGKTESIGPMLLAIAVVSAIAIAIGTLSFSSYQKSLEVRGNEINMCADYLGKCAPDLSANMEKIGSRDSLHGSEDELIQAIYDLSEATRPALLLTQAASENNIGMYCTVYGKDDKGVFYLLGSSVEYVMGTSVRTQGSENLEAAFEGAPTSSGLMRGHTLRDATQYRLVQIPSSDGQSVAGVIEIGSKTRSFELSIIADLGPRILALLVMVLVVYLAYTELRACGRCLFTYRQRRQENLAEAAAALTRPFTLAVTLLTSIDSVMTVLIARNLLANMGVGDTSQLLAIPAVMLGIGLVLGQTLYAYAGSRVGLRRLISVGAIGMLLCACFTGVAVASGIFWLYCVAKLILSVPFGMLYTLGYSLQRLAHNDEARAEAAGGVKRTDTSGAALGTVLGGYAAQVLGDVWVYALVAIACIPIIIMAINLLPRGMKSLEDLAQPDWRSARGRDFVKTAPAITIALLIVLPATLASGYASFLFPLFSSDLGLTKADINNIVVMGQLVVFVGISRIERLDTRFGKWRVSVTAIALLGAVFLLFSINATLAWSVAVIALVGLLCKASDGWKALWQRAASEADVPAGPTISAMYTTRSITLIAQPFILGALLGSTDSFAVIVIGAICLLCACLFFFMTRKTSLNK